MTIRPTFAAIAAATALTLMGNQAHATTTVFATGLPAGGLANSLTVDSANWVAERFTLTSATTIDSLQAFVMSTDAGDVGLDFTMALYADQPVGNGFLPAVNFYAPDNGQLAHTSVTYQGDGWASSATGLNWTLPAGNYWVALEGGTASFLQAPTGALPAASAVAYYAGSGLSYTATGSADAFGVTVTAVPEPESAGLALAGLLLLAASKRLGRRSR